MEERLGSECQSRLILSCGCAVGQQAARAGVGYAAVGEIACVTPCVTAAASVPQVKMLRSLALALVAAASTEAFMAPAAWTSKPVSNRAVAKSGLTSLNMKVSWEVL